MKEVKSLINNLFFSNVKAKSSHDLGRRVARMACIFLCQLTLFCSAANAQTNDLQSLLNLYPESTSISGETTPIFTAGGKLRIDQVDAILPYTVVRQTPKWKMVKFSVPTIPVWVSKDYINESHGIAEIRADRLNGRLRPSIQSPILIGLQRGYTSTVLDSKNGFAKIKAPAALVVAMDNTGLQAQANSTEPQAPVRSRVEQKNETRQDKAPAAELGSNPTVLETTTNVMTDPNQGTRPDSQVAVIQTVESPIFEGQTAGDQAMDSGAAVDSVVATESEVEELRQSEPAEVPQNVQDQLHQIAPGDAISLIVFGEQDLSTQSVRVPQSGRVSLPLIGTVSVVGKTTKQVEDEVRTILAQGYVKNPRLSVSIFSYRPIFIRGAIRSVGAFPYTEGLTIAKAVALAGGTKKSAQDNGVSISRDGETVETGLALDSQYQVASGDVISIAENLGVTEDAALYIYLHGEVASPGEYLFRRGLTVEKAVVLAGGFTLRGSPNKVTVTRYNGVSDNEEPQKMKGVELYTPVEPGDVINVGARWF